MPELPEVQTIISDLNKKIVGDSIVDFWSDWPKTIKKNGKSASSARLAAKRADDFTREIKNRKILRARRIGKNLFIDLSGNKTLYIHLKMTGHLLIKSQIPISKAQTNSKSKNPKIKNFFNDRVNQYIHHIFYLKSQKANLKTDAKKNKKFVDSPTFVGSNRYTLEFSDMRKFAKIVLDDTEKINNLPEIRNLGVDAMSKDFTLEKFGEIISKKSASRRSKPIGIVLMEQELISGIGNIYRSEILFEAGISPLRRTGKISETETKKLYQSIQKVLKKAIKMRGTSDSDYRDTAGAPGSFQKVLKVYRLAGKKCPKCGTIIKRLKLGQRSAFYCPNCQK
jgi:formamidopyrimidine-DNA glycosylase